MNVGLFFALKFTGYICTKNYYSTFMRFILFGVLMLTQLLSWAQCDSFFVSADKYEICEPNIVTFKLNRSVAGASYQWNVGQGWTSGADTFFTYYNAADTVKGQVRITLPSGAVCLITDTLSLIVRERPVPKIWMSANKLCYGSDSIEFRDITNGSVKRNWVIDGTNYNNANDSLFHYFVTLGTKTVSLVVVDSFGCQGVLSLKDTIKVYKNLNYDFTADVNSGCRPLTVDVSPTTSVSVPFAKTFRWDFLGSTNTKDTAEDPAARVYKNPGTFDVNLTVSLDNGCVYKTLKPAFIKVGDTIGLNINYSKSSACLYEEIEVSVSNTPLPGPVRYIVYDLPHATQKVDDHTMLLSFNDTGRARIRAILNYNGCISNVFETIPVKIKSVEAKYYSDDNFHCKLPHVVHLYDSSDKRDANSLTYRWNIYNGGKLYDSSTAQNDSFTFNSMPGYYDVELIVTGDNGCKDTFYKDSFIYTDEMNLDFLAIPDIACVNQDIRFLNSTKRTTYMATDSFTWYFYGLDDTTVLDTSFVRNPIRSYADTGFYDVLLIGRNALGCNDTLKVDSAVHIISPRVLFDISDSIICLGDSITLEGKSTPTDVVFNHNWSLDHLSIDTVFAFSGEYVRIGPALAGKYNLIYTVDIDSGCYSSDSMSISVNQLQGEIILDSMLGCSPFTVYPEYGVNTNLHTGSTDSNLVFLWSVSPSNNTVSIDTNTSSPSFTLNNDGLYTVNVVAVNATGCADTTSLDSIQVGVVAELVLLDSAICLGDTLFVQNQSRFTGMNVNWDVTGPGSASTVYSSDSLYGIYIQDSGQYNIQLVVDKDNKCADSISYDFNIIQVIAEFSATDSFLNCAPVYVQFTSTSVNADSLIWDFGDGTRNTTTKPSAGTIYQKNSGLQDGYDIMLIAKHVEGCLDTALKVDYVVVKGPRPKFSMVNNIGCDPLNVSFVNESEDADLYYLNYNDGSELDSLFSDHEYVSSTTNLVEEIYPSLIVYDSLGCIAYYRSDTPVVLYKTPQADLNLQVGSSECLPLDVLFRDQSLNQLSTTWLLDGIPYSKQRTDSARFFTSGFHEVMLVTTNTNECVDTATEQVFASGIPELDIEILDTLCLNKSIEFAHVISVDNNTDTTGMTLIWSFGEIIGEMDTLSSPTVSYEYPTPGLKTIVLRSVMLNGCESSDSINIKIRGPLELDIPQIRVVSFVDNYNLSLEHEISIDPRFSLYQLNRSDGWQLDKTGIDDTFSIFDLGTKPWSSLCYDLHIKDICELDGPSSEPHCFIHLTVTSTQPFTNLVQWTPYVGWGGVKEYEVYRMAEGESEYSLLGITSDTTFSDSLLCEQLYSYKVKAVHSSEPLESWSFSESCVPQYPRNEVPSDIRNVTVEGANEILIYWNSSSFSRHAYYILNKYKNDESNWVESIILNDTFYVDLDVQTSEHSYVYTITAVDECGYSSPTGREGKSILLNALYNDDLHQAELSWTPYRQWDGGVQNYIPAIYDLGTDQDLALLSGNSTNYSDPEHHPNVVGAYCYRVHATNTDNDTSYSNVVCVYGRPIVFVPNAFTPNGDNTNEGFRPIMTFVQNDQVNGRITYLFEVYNRWGELVFSTTDQTQAWNGTYLQEDCQQDVYLYRLECQGLNGEMYSYRGTVTLLR